jgi:hypothetical protein
MRNPFNPFILSEAAEQSEEEEDSTGEEEDTDAAPESLFLNSEAETG